MSGHNSGTKCNVLVFPCGSEIGLEIYRSLAYSIHFELFGGSSIDDHGRFVFNNYFGGLPLISDDDFIEKLNQLIRRHNISYIFPAHDDVVLSLAQAKEEGRLACDVVTSPLQTCQVARSKSRTYDALKGIVPTPRLYSSAEEVGVADYPVFLKPDVGQGSKDTQQARTPEQLKAFLDARPGLIVVEYLPGREYTIDCFTDKDGRLRFSEARIRSRIANGISVQSWATPNNALNDMANKINQALSFRGVWFFQVKEDVKGKFVLMEVAPRVAGTMGLVRCRGVNLPLLSLFNAMGHEVMLIENNYKMTIDRALQGAYQHDIDYRHVYLDFDDMVIVNGKVNPLVMAFVYQCHNKQIETHLITKHAGDLQQALKKFRLENAFNELIWLRDGGEKHQYITKSPAIFIDDSFAERQSVHKFCQIPVFDSHMIEGLMEGAL